MGASFEAQKPTVQLRRKKICIAGTGRVAPFDTVRAAAGYHVAGTIEHKVDLFRIFVMMRKIRSAGVKLHNEEADEHLASGDLVALTFRIAHQELIEDGIGMARDRLPFHVVEVGDQRLRGRCCMAGRRHLVSHDDNAHAGGAGHGVPHTGRQVEEVVLSYREFLARVIQASATLQNDVGLFLNS